MHALVDFQFPKNANLIWLAIGKTSDGEGDSWATMWTAWSQCHTAHKILVQFHHFSQYSSNLH